MKKNALPISSRLGIIILILLSAMLLASAGHAQDPLPGFAKSFSPSNIGPGSISTLQLVITNSGASPVRGLAFSDNLPTGMTVASPTNAASTCLGTLSALEGGSTILFSDGGVAPGSSCTITVDVTSSTPGTHTNTTGDLTSDAGNSGPATADLTVATDRPGFSKRFTPNAVFFGGRSTLTLTIDNTANTVGAINMSFTDNLPVGMVIASPPNASSTCSGGNLTAARGGSVISYAPNFPGDASVAAGASCTISVDVLGNAIGVLGNTTGELLSLPQTGGFARSSGKAGATLTVTVEQISLTKNFIDDPTAPGGTVTLGFTVINLDRNFSATDITFSDDLEAVVSGLTAVGLPIADPCGAGSVLSGTSILTLSGGNLPPEGMCTFSVTVQVPATALGTYTNTTSVIAANVDGRPVTGDPATDLLFVEAGPALSKTFLDDPVAAGGVVVLEFTITNTSPEESATDITFEDVFDIVLPTASTVPAAGFCGAGSTATYTPLFNPIGSGADVIPARLVVTNASLAAGASCTFSITLDVSLGAATGIYPNTTSAISATVGEGTVSGAPASDDLEIVAAPILRKEFIDDPVAAGDTVTLQFTLFHDEGAPGDATGIAFSDDLDAALTGLVATGLPAVDVCGTGSSLTGTMTLLLSGGSLAPGESCTFNVTLQTPAAAPAGSHTNTTSNVVATVLGVETMTNPASADLQIAGLIFTKEFLDDPVLPGSLVTLQFTIANVSPASDATNIVFRDDLNEALSNLAVTSTLPLNDICGTGSMLSGSSGNRLLTFQGGSLAAGASCTFDVTLRVPAATAPDVYVNRTSGLIATIDGTPNVVFDGATDQLEVITEFLMLSKEFTDDPVSPGGNVNLRFTLTSLSGKDAVVDIAFSDDLDAALAGLVSTSGTLADVCGAGSQLSGTNFLALTGGSLAAGASCTFDVSLAVPATVQPGTIVINTTSGVTGTIGTTGVTGEPASDTLQLNFLAFSKSFDGDVLAGNTALLTFTIQNLSPTTTVSALSFSDDLSAVLTGLEAIGLPATDVCGTGSTLDGSSFLTFSGGSLLPNGSCSFSVAVQVPATTAAGSYLNVTSALVRDGLPVAPPATATLVVIGEQDDDEDGVLNEDDACPDTVIPEGVPTHGLRPNRYALVDNDFTFDTIVPGGGGPGDVFTTTDTAGCSCEQIIEELDLGKGHQKHGCSVGAMRNWVKLVSSP